jgi:hypothetical protein
MLKNLKEYLPSEGFRKRVLIIIGILVLGLGTWQVIKLAPWKKWGEGEIATLQPGTGQPGIVVSSLTESDQDNDGLPDWEERFWGTDPENPDSNGDGISDGVEVTKKKETDGVSIDTQNLNETELFAQKLAKTGFTIGQAGEITEDGATLLGDKFLEDIKAIKKYQVYDKSVIKSRGSASQKNIEAYAADVTKVMNVTKIGNDISVTITGKALQDGTPDELKRLDPIIAMYTKATADMLKIPVPVGFEQVHLDLINGYARMRDDTKSMKEAFTNPALVTSVISNTEERFDMLLNAINMYVEKLRQYAEKK